MKGTFGISLAAATQWQWLKCNFIGQPRQVFFQGLCFESGNIKHVSLNEKSHSQVSWDLGCCRKWRRVRERVGESSLYFTEWNCSGWIFFWCAQCWWGLIWLWLPSLLVCVDGKSVSEEGGDEQSCCTVARLVSCFQTLSQRPRITIWPWFIHHYEYLFVLKV